MPLHALSFKNDMRKMMTTSSDTLMKVISKVCVRILTHFDWYGDDFLPNSLFKFFQGVRPIFKNLLLQVLFDKKSQMLESGKCVGDPTSPLRETRHVGNICHSFVIKTQAVWAIASFYWNQMISLDTKSSLVSGQQCPVKSHAFKENAYVTVR